MTASEHSTLWALLGYLEAGPDCSCAEYDEEPDEETGHVAAGRAGPGCGRHHSARLRALLAETTLEASR